MAGLSNTLKKLLLPKHLLLGVGLSVLLIFVISIANMLTLKRINNDIEQIYSNDLVPLSHIKEANADLFDIERTLKKVIIAQSPKARSEALSDISKREQLFREEIAKARQGITHADNMKRLSLIQSLYEEYLRNIDRAMSMMEHENVHGENPIDYILNEDFQRVIVSVDKLLDEIAASKELAAKESLNEAAALHAQVQLVYLGVLSGLLLIAVAVAYYFKLVYASPLNQLRTSIDKLVAGNLNVPVPYADQQNLVGMVANSINRVKDILKAKDSCIKAHSNISRAVLSDIDSIIKLIAANADDYAFNSSMLAEGHLQQVASVMKATLGTGLCQKTTWDGNVEIAPNELWVYKLAGRVVAFAQIEGLNNRAGLERELHAIAVDPAYRGQGIGGEIFNVFCIQFVGRDLYVECKPNSKMMRMATHKGFAFFAKKGANVILKRPADFGIHNKHSQAENASI